MDPASEQSAPTGGPPEDAGQFFCHPSTGLLLLGLLALLSASLLPWPAPLRYYFKHLVLVLGFFISSSLVCVHGLFHWNDPHKNALFTTWCSRYVDKACGISWNVQFEEPLDKKKAYVLVANHQSSIDVLGILKVWYFIGHCVVLGKKSLLYLGPFGIALSFVGTYFVERSNREKGRKAVEEAGNYARKTGTSVTFFPEGTRNLKRDFQMLPFKKGAFHMALDAGIPVVPIVFEQYNFLNPKKYLFGESEILVKVLKPIPVEEYSKDNLDDLVTLTRDRMLEKLKEISKPL